MHHSLTMQASEQERQELDTSGVQMEVGLYLDSEVGGTPWVSHLSDDSLDFWQGAPRGLDIRGAGGDTAAVTLWAYSPRVSIIRGLITISNNGLKGSRY